MPTFGYLQVAPQDVPKEEDYFAHKSGDATEPGKYAFVDVRDRQGNQFNRAYVSIKRLQCVEGKWFLCVDVFDDRPGHDVVVGINKPADGHGFTVGGSVALIPRHLVALFLPGGNITTVKDGKLSDVLCHSCGASLVSAESDFFELWACPACGTIGYVSD